MPLDNEGFELSVGTLTTKNRPHLGNVNSNMIGRSAERRVALVSRACVRCGLTNFYALEPGKLV